MHLWPIVAFDLLYMNTDWLWEVDAHGNLTKWISTRDIKNGMKSRLQGDPKPWRDYLRCDQTCRDGLASLLRAVKNSTPFECLRVACHLPHANVHGWLQLTGVPFADEHGTFMGYRGAAKNITGQLMTERKLARIDHIYKGLMTAIDCSASMIFLADPDDQPDMRIQYANPAFAKVSGYAKEDVVGKPTMFLFGEKTDKNAASMLRENVRRNGQASAKLQLHRRDGSTFWALITLVLGGNEGRRVLVGTIRDISAEMNFEAAEEQRGRLEAIGRLAGGMAHEINNLLQPLQLNAEIIGDELASHPDLLPFVEDIKASLNQISFIVRNTLQFSRKNEQVKSHQPQPFIELMEDRIRFLRNLIPSTVAIMHDWQIKPTDMVDINQTELTQVLTNLGTNASHAMKGHGTLTFRLRHCQIDGVRESSRGLPLGNYFELFVSDTGCGMTPELLARVFEPFFTTKPVGEGTGLGLSVVYGLVAGWGGHIEVSSIPGEGTTFSILIPQVTDNKEGE